MSSGRVRGANPADDPFAAAESDIGWSSDFVVVDGLAPTDQALQQLDAAGTDWVVILRHGGQLLYVFATRDLQARLRHVLAGDRRPLEAVLQLHETQASTRVQDRAQLVPLDRTWRMGEAAPSVMRYVEVDDGGQPLAVGGADVRAHPRSRSRRRGGARPPPASEAAAAAADDFDALAIGDEHWVETAAPAAASAAPETDASPVPVGAAPMAEDDAPSAGGGAAAAAAPSDDDLDVPPGDEGTTPVRHPSIEARRPLVADAPISFAVDLLHHPSPSTGGGPLALGEQAADWQMLKMGVTLVSAGIDFDAGGRGKILIRRNARSVAATVTGRVLDTQQPGDTIDVMAQFWNGTRCCGSALRSFVVSAPGQALKANPTGPTEGTMQADPRAARPDLAVYITLFDRSSPGRMHWRMVTEPFDGLPPKLDGTIDLGQDPRAEAAAMFKQFANLVRGQHRARIEGFGERLWDLAPAEFRAVYWALSDHWKRPLTIQFISDDPHLPWELMRPYRDGEVHPLLAERHAVARWIGRYQGWMSNRLPAGRLVAIAPKYRSASARLSRAEATAEELVSTLSAKRVNGTLAEMRGLLEQPPDGTVALLFFTGHGLFDAGSAAASAIKLEDGNLAVDEVGRREVRLGERDGTLVFFNACEVGATAAALGDVGGWANAFLSRRFRAFIAPLWAIDEEDAAQVTRELMTQIVGQRQPIGAALRDLRARHGDTSPTFLSYLLYGDVTACLNGP